MVSIRACLRDEDNLNRSRVFVVVTVQYLPDGRQIGTRTRPGGVVRRKVPVHESRVVCGARVPL